MNERPAAITLTKPTLIREQLSAMAALLSVPSAPARADDGRFFLFLIRHARLDGHVTGAETFRSDDNLSSISAAVAMPMCSFATQCALCVTGGGGGVGGAGLRRALLSSLSALHLSVGRLSLPACQPAGDDDDEL